MPAGRSLFWCTVSTPSFSSLKAFLETAPAALKATRSLSREAEVGVLLDGDVQARFTMASGGPALLAEPAANPDFTLRLPDRAVAQLTSIGGDEVGEYGVTFFTLVTAVDPAEKVRISIHAPTTRLIAQGYLGVLAMGGVQVMGWLLRKGIRNPKAAIDRLRGGR